MIWTRSLLWMLFAALALTFAGCTDKNQANKREAAPADPQAMKEIQRIEQLYFENKWDETRKAIQTAKQSALQYATFGAEFDIMLHICALNLDKEPEKLAAIQWLGDLTNKDLIKKYRVVERLNAAASLDTNPTELQKAAKKSVKKLKKKEDDPLTLHAMKEVRRIEKQFYAEKFDRVRKEIREALNDERRFVAFKEQFAIMLNVCSLNMDSDKEKIRAAQELGALENKLWAKNYLVSEYLRRAATFDKNPETVKKEARAALEKLRAAGVIADKDTVLK